MSSCDQVLVAGSANIDVMLQVPRNPHQGESLVVAGQRTGLGGKGSNRAIALHRMGLDVQFCCKLGHDSAGDLVLDTLETEQIGTRLVKRDEQIGTGTAYIMIAPDGKNTILSYMGANNSFTDADIADIIANLSTFSYLSLELECSLSLIEQLLHHGRKQQKVMIVDAGPIREMDMDWFRDVDVFSPNETEASQWTGFQVDTEEAAREACRKLYTVTGSKNVLLKRGEHGAMLYDGREVRNFPAYRHAGKVVDTTAAGDCFMAALTLAMTRQLPLEKAVYYANVAAAIAVTRPGAAASLPTGAEADRMFAKAQEGGYVQ
ncbi:ribokinase [Paenibacillus thiaminolyticus]|uniref:ribokinase n=1 Tax=Paenibacillus thiaminolyticus TaxID=49283 RepID=UPI0035A64C9D